ncbi:MAG: methyltransferase domain-containing protein [Proteobacteria bacterium]|nr:MAG: methyltransferase domain-containing protein [Pseudomonadota bacterium]
MDESIITTYFGEAHAPFYDERWRRMSSINELLHFLMRAILSELPKNARILCVGAGTGAEILALAAIYPTWQFVAVEPSLAMLDVCRAKAIAAGIADRCEFHGGFLQTLTPSEPFDAATAILVSQFIMNRDERKQFFQDIGKRLRPKAFMINADLASDLNETEYEDLVQAWLATQSDVKPVGPSTVSCPAWKTTVAVSEPAEIEAIVKAAGFTSPVRFYQALFIHAWYSRWRAE